MHRHDNSLYLGFSCFMLYILHVDLCVGFLAFMNKN